MYAMHTIHPYFQKILKPILAPFSYGYSFFMNVRYHLYRLNLLKSWSPPVFCISVGNISLGGTGKTSLCIWLLKWLKKKGYNPALLTRGYRAKPPFLPFYVSEDVDPDLSGDEPLMITKKCKGIPVVVDPDRARGGRWAIERFKPDVFVLDDGFQHLKIKRHIELVLLSLKDLSRKEDSVLPLGRRREGWNSLKRADAFLLNVYPQYFFELKEKLKTFNNHFKRPVFTFYLQITSLIQVSSWHRIPLNALDKKRYILVSGLAEPSKFELTAKNFLKGTLVKHIKFADHHRFSKRDGDRIKKEKKALNGDIVICSLKDGVKLKKIADNSLFALDFELGFGPFISSKCDFQKWLEERIRMLS